MSEGTDMQRRCEERLRSLVADDETVLAVGAADEFAQPAGDLGVQGRWRTLVVTEKRLLLADWSRPQDPHEEITFDQVKGWSDGSQYHRYVICLKHPPMTRMEWAPAHRFLGLEWGNAREPRTRTTTTLRFSHRETEAAKALRTVLGARAVSHGELSLPEVSREERTRGSHVELRPE